jgi:hypothetical protein
VIDLVAVIGGSIPFVLVILLVLDGFMQDHLNDD